MIEIRLRTRTHPDHVKNLAGKVLGPADYDVLLTGPARVTKPDGRPLAVYLPGALTHHTQDPEVYRVLHGLRSHTSNNRGLASGARLVFGGTADAPSVRADALPVPSAIIGSVDPMGQRLYCRLTAWTGRNLPDFEKLRPFLQTIAAELAAHVPDRHAAQMAEIRRTDPAWVVPGTPFTTITVNNSYPTGVHVDKGDLDAGFSTIACLRRGTYTGGQLIFPEYRIAADLRDGDLLLMDAHDWHGNAPITCACGSKLRGPCRTCQAERISSVAYYRARMTGCGDPAAEAAKGRAVADRRSKLDT